jgi:hypothetical protein
MTSNRQAYNRMTALVAADVLRWMSLPPFHERVSETEQRVQRRMALFGGSQEDSFEEEMRWRLLGGSVFTVVTLLVLIVVLALQWFPRFHLDIVLAMALPVTSVFLVWKQRTWRKRLLDA